MSTVKAVNFQHPSSAAANLTLAADGTVTGGLPAGGRNLLYNGAMQVAQRGTSTASITGVGYYTADRWWIQAGDAVLGTWTQSVENDAPTGSGLRKSLKMLCTTANASPGASNSTYITQTLEGQDVQRIAKGTASAQQLTLSFWVKANVTGTYIVFLWDRDNSRTVSASYSVSASATWERKTITFPADTTGVFDNDNAGSLEVNFMLGCGSAYTSGTLGTTWASLTYGNIAPGQTNLAAATNNYWQVTGVQLEVGPVASAFEFKPYGQELRECQRYYYLAASGTAKSVCVGWYYTATEVDGLIHFPTTMRTAPSLVMVSGTGYYEIVRNGGSDAFNSGTIYNPQQNAAQFYNNTEASGTAGQAGAIYTSNASSSIAFSAEL